MLTLLITLASFAPSNAAKPPRYDVTFTTSAAGHEITASHLTLEAGKPAKVSQADANGTVEVEIGAQPQKNGGVFIAANIVEIAKNGARRDLGKPQIIARAGEPAAIEYGDKDKKTGQDKVHFQMRVLAKVKN